MEDAGDVGGYEVLAFSYADDDGGTETGGDDLVGFERGEDAEGEGSGEALDGVCGGLLPMGFWEPRSHKRDLWHLHLRLGLRLPFESVRSGGLSLRCRFR